MKPLIGISCCSKQFGPFNQANHATSDTYIRAVDALTGGVAMLIPANGRLADVPTLLDHLDGVILTGSRSNVAPHEYGGPAHPADTLEDPARDDVTLPLIRSALRRNLPLLAICRGLQEANVALGGTLHQRLQDLPSRLDHSTPMLPNQGIRHGKAHSVAFVPGGLLHCLADTLEVEVNSLHNQGINRLAPGLIVEATAPDGTVEAVRYSDAPFALAVQWHPEYDYDSDPLSRAIFVAFGAAVRKAALLGAAAAD